MPGLAIVLEALTRAGQGHNSQAWSGLVTVAVTILTAPGGCDTPSSLSACLSLAATLRKILWLSTKHSGPEREWQRQQQLERRQQQEEQLTLSEVTLMSQSLCGALHSVGRELVPQSCVKLDTSNPLQAVAVICQKELMRIQAASSLRSLENSTTGVDPNVSDTMYAASAHHIQAVTMLSLLQLCESGCAMQHQQEEESGHEFRLLDTLTAVSKLSIPKLMPVVKLHMEQIIQMNYRFESDFRMAAAAWERHAVTNFHGRLLPGCCNLACSNLDGVSEAALPTQICGGCRKARYCCVECQRVAWVEGGHSIVCGKSNVP